MQRYAHKGRPTNGPLPATPWRKGFTVVEILVAMVLAAFGVLGFTGLLRAIGDLEAEDTWKTKAVFCAQERLEELRFGLAAWGGAETQGKDALAEGPYQGMQREWGVKDCPLFDGLEEVRAACAYPWKGDVKKVELSTLVFPES